jgi:hypothetical protein
MVTTMTTMMLVTTRILASPHCCNLIDSPLMVTTMMLASLRCCCSRYSLVMVATMTLVTMLMMVATMV